MKKPNWILSTPALALVVAAHAAGAQSLELPRPSPGAKITQTVGLTEIAVEYSCPGVKGRKIWGGQVPLDELWRTGANQATKITFSKDVRINDSPVPAGSYSIFTIPSVKKPWTVIFNKNATASTREYKQDQDLLRISAKPSAIPSRERLAFLFSNFDDAGTSLDLEWEKVRISIPIKVATEEQAAAGIKAMADSSWRPYNNAARYLLEAKKDNDLAMKLIDQSIALKEEWVNLWTKAQLLAANKKYKEAYPLAERAKALGDKAEFFYFADDVKKALVDWKGK